MSYYQQQYDPRYFAPNPQFPAAQKSSSWIGWLLMVIGALISGYILGQSEKTEPHEKPKDDVVPKIDGEPPVVPTLAEKTETLPEPQGANAPKKLIELGDDIIDRLTADFDNINMAERLFMKREFQENPQLIIKYPVLAKLLGFKIENNDAEENTQPL